MRRLFPPFFLLVYYIIRAPPPVDLCLVNTSILTSSYFSTRAKSKE